jgi:hypothetical protein
MAQELLEINFDELCNETLMKHHSCNILQFNNKKLNKKIKKMKSNIDEEPIFYDKLHEQISKKTHSSVGIRERLKLKLKEKK